MYGGPISLSMYLLRLTSLRLLWRMLSQLAKLESPLRMGISGLKEVSFLNRSLWIVDMLAVGIGCETGTLGGVDLGFAEIVRRLVWGVSGTSISA
jgi:hypothetical protein